MPKYQLEYLKHIRDEIEFIIKISKTIRKEVFQEDDVLKRALVRSLEIIGEAVKKLSPDFREKYNHVDWKAIAGMRDKLIHDYAGVDYDLVWDVAVNEIPLLKEEIEGILIKEKG
jgi:uncharacterized protein with HEPN domain